ncbi:hypothetical protein EA82_03148 [Enterococcus hirae]|nr:hypothetical protein CUM72_14165 [Enterococcus durans]RBT65399.1 hypothetical protein EA82_03148 [Enterococcus hirae]
MSIFFTIIFLVIAVPFVISIVSALLKIKGKVNISWVSVFIPIFLLLGCIAFLVFGLLLMYFANYSL